MNVALQRGEGGAGRLLRDNPGLTVFAFSAVLAIVGFIVLYPFVFLLIKSFQAGPLGANPTFVGLDNWRIVFTEPQMVDALRNTITLGVARQAIALVLGMALAWALARTNIPGRCWLELGFWVALFLPTLTVTLGWIILLDGSRGLLTQALAGVPLIGSIDIFSWWGIVFAHLMAGSIAVSVMLLLPAIRSLDASLEEASITSGASTLSTMLRVTLPAMAPALVLVTVFGVVRSLDAFEIELVLGAADGIDIYSTVIFREITAAAPQYASAAVLGVTALSLLTPLVVLQRWVSKRGASDDAGRRAHETTDLGRGRWPVFALVGGLLLMMTVVPVLAVAVGSFMKLTGGSFTDGPWTLANWRSMIDGGTLRGLGDTVFLGVLSALFAMAILTVIAYLSVRPRLQGRGMLEALVRVPGSIPGIVWGLGWLFLLLAGTVPFSESRPLGSLYGGIGAMVLVVTIAGITVGVQIIGVRIAQVGAGIEEAAWTAGASRLHTVRSVLLPLVGPAILVVGVITFSTAVRATSLIALLAPHEARPLSLVQMDQMLAGGFGQASVGGVFLAVLGVGAVLIGRALGLRTGGGLR